MSISFSVDRLINLEACTTIPLPTFRAFAFHLLVFSRLFFYISKGKTFISSSTGSRPSPAQEITPTSLRLHKPAAAAAASPHATQQAHRLHSPSPAILNFTLQNLGLISGSSPVNGFAAPQTPDSANTLQSPLALHQRGMVFLKPVSPMPIQQSVSGQPVTLISVQQVKKKNVESYTTCEMSCLISHVALEELCRV